MDGEYSVSTDKQEKIKLESQIVAADWLSPVARGGSFAQLRVRTTFVAEGAEIEIKGKSSEGKAPDSIKGKITGNEFKGEILIPEKVKAGAEIWFEAKLPKHGLKRESGMSIIAKPPISVSKLCWDKKEVTRGEMVTMTCQFADGVVDGDDVVFVIFEHDPNSYDFKVTSFPVFVKGNKAEAVWAFEYDGDTAKIPTEEELKKVGKHYAPPQYYFIAVIDGVRAGEKRESGLLEFKDSLTINITDGDGQPCKKFKGSIIYANGKREEFSSDENGQWNGRKIPPGRIGLVLDQIDELSFIDEDSLEAIPIRLTENFRMQKLRTGVELRFQLMSIEFSM